MREDTDLKASKAVWNHNNNKVFAKWYSATKHQPGKELVIALVGLKFLTCCYEFACGQHHNSKSQRTLLDWQSWFNIVLCGVMYDWVRIV
jgi:hypothetical protein